MKRRNALKLFGAGIAGLSAWQISRLLMLDQISQGPKTEKMPLLFVGHGSPMNAIDVNPFTKALNSLGGKIPRPHAILVVSAHWMSEGTWVTEMPQPKTIHDFYGFPQELFDIKYPAPGSPEVARLIRQTVKEPQVHGDTEMWGLDHGTWSVLRHLYPKADIPVLQMSLYMEQPPEYHFKVGEQLRTLRERGILILGSGNLVHNLRRIKWEPDAQPYDWALEYDEWLKKQLSQKQFQTVLNDFHKTEAGKLSVPTLDHYFPLHYVLGASDAQDELRFEYEEIQNGSISMRTISLGLKT